MTDKKEFEETGETKPDEIREKVLAEAKSLGVKHHPSIGTEKLQEKIALHKQPETVAEPPRKKWVPETERAKNARLRKAATRLVRVSISCMDPSKSKYPGEILTVANTIIGTSIKRFVPFNTTEDGTHIEYAIYLMMKERKFQTFYEVKRPNKPTIKRSKLQNMFNIALLDPLTPTELKELAKRQALNHSIDE